MMKLEQSQRGATLTTIAFYLFLLGFSVFTALKLVPVYMESFTIRSVMEGMSVEKGREYTGSLKVREAVLKRFGINNITQVGADDVVVVREDDAYVITVDYEVRIPFISNIDFVLVFTNEAEVKAR